MPGRCHSGVVGRTYRGRWSFAVVLVAAVMLVWAGPTAQASVTLEVLDDTSGHTVIEYDVGAYQQEFVDIEGLKYSTLELPGESILSVAGAPAVPHVCRSVIIPDTAAVTVKVVDAAYEEITDFDLVPSKGTLLRTVSPEDVPYSFGPAYARDAFYPGPLAELSAPYILRDYRGVVVRVNPFQYNPVTRTLRVYHSLTVEVNQAGDGKTNVLRRQPGAALSRAFHQVYKHHFVNFPTDDRYAPLDESGDMLVICYDSWLANVQPLVDHKNGIGLNTTAVGVSTIGNNATSIKNYIQNLYDTSDLAFVLLVGDSGQVATPSASGGAADPTYALLAGSDHYPDILVGRFSAETSAQVDTQVQRTVDYEVNEATTQDWFWRGVGIGSAEGDGIGDDGEADFVHIGNIRTDLLNYGYTLVDQVYDPGASASTVSAAVNAGRGIINYCGHGSTTSWGTTGFSNTDVNNLTNVGMWPFIIDVACVNGEFDGPTCFAEAWVRATSGGQPTGAIGIYASSINQSWAPPMCAQDEAVDLFCAETYVSLGTLCFAGSCQMMDEYGSDGEQMFDTWHLFGDPSLRVVGTVAPPTGLKVTPGTALAAAGPIGGPFTPNSIVYTLENQNDTGLDYTVSKNEAWVSLDNTGGYLASHATAIVTVSINASANALAGGQYSDVVTFVNLTDHDGDTTRDVGLQVGGPQLVYDFTLDTDPGWSTQGQWAFGVPTGGGSHSLDPTSGHTGGNVYGYNLNGDYTDNMPQYNLKTTALDCSGLTSVELRFWKWLGVESSSYDHASVQVSNDGSAWTSVWSHSGGSVSDAAWSQITFDISAVADDQGTVYVRWCMGTTDSSVTYPGWNVDDVEIWGMVAPTVPGDYDGDGDVDLVDYAVFSGCMTGPGGGPVDESCAPGDMDHDTDIDVSDFALFQAAFTG